MKRKSMLWLAIAAFVVYVGLLTPFSFPKLEKNLNKSVSGISSLKTLDNSDIEWNGRNGYLTVPADIDKSQAEQVKSDIEQIQGVRNVKIIYDNARVSDKAKGKDKAKEKDDAKAKAKDGKFRMDWTQDDKKISGEFNKSNAGELHKLFGVKISKFDSDATIKDEIMEKLKKMKPDLFSNLSEGALEVDGDKIKVSGVASQEADIDGLKSKWNSLGGVDMDIKAPEMKQENKDMKELPTDYEFVNIYFESGGTVVSNNSIKVVDEIAATLNEYEGVYVDIIGHTDNWGSFSDNLTLSEQRAEAVMDMLADKGVDKSRMTSYGKGERDPIANNATALGREENRRVEIHVKENS